MAQIFSPGADTWLRLFFVLAIIASLSVFAIGMGVVRSSYLSEEDVHLNQPVPFSHEHHVGGLGIDCRYCHTAVETSATAGFPPTETCMTCHSQIWTGAPMLAPVRESLANDEPLRWNWVYKLPEFVYFNHSIHVAKGVGCVECHGRIDTQPLTRQVSPLFMGWCLDCHRDPAPRLRPREAVFDLQWSAPQDRERLGQELMEAYHIDPARLDHCYVCHR